MKTTFTFYAYTKSGKLVASICGNASTLRSYVRYCLSKHLPAEPVKFQILCHTTSRPNEEFETYKSSIFTYRSYADFNRKFVSLRKEAQDWYLPF